MSTLPFANYILHISSRPWQTSVKSYINVPMEDEELCSLFPFLWSVWPLDPTFCSSPQSQHDQIQNNTQVSVDHHRHLHYSCMYYIPGTLLFEIIMLGEQPVWKSSRFYQGKWWQGCRYSYVMEGRWLMVESVLLLKFSCGRYEMEDFFLSCFGC